MENSNKPSPVKSPPPKRRFKLFSWRTLGRCLIGLALLATLIALFYAEENWRGRRAWENYRREAEARGLNFDWKKLVPPPVPDDQNFAMTPFLAPLFDMNPRPFNGNIYRDTNGFNRTQKFAEDLLHGDNNLNAPVNPGWELTDLPALAAELKKNLKSPNARLAVAAHPDAGNTEPDAPRKIHSQPEEIEFLNNYLKQYDPVLEEIRTASRRPYSRFNVHYEDKNPAGILLPHLIVVKNLAIVFKTKAAVELAQGKPDAAADDVRVLLHLADSIKSEPFIISSMVQVAIIGLAEKTIWEGFAQHAWTDTQLRALESELTGIPLLREAYDALNGERVFFGVGWFDYAREDHGLAFNVFDDVSGEAKVLFGAMPKGWSYQEQTSYQRFFEEKLLPGLDVASAQLHPRFIDEVSHETSHPKHGDLYFLFHHQVLARALTPALEKLYQKVGYCQTGLDEAALACALERYRSAHGAYPEKLEMLVPKFIDKLPLDVCSGEPLKYRLTATNSFLLYGVGWNQKDDGGAIGSKPQGKRTVLDLSEGDWVWPAYLSQ